MPKSIADFVSRGAKLLLENPVTALRYAGRYLLPMRADYRRRWGISLADWLRRHQNEIVFENCHWWGVRSHKNPMDAWIYQEILYEVRPDVVVEIGSAHGGTTLFLSHLCDLIGTGTVVSVEIDRSRFEVSHPRIAQVTGDSGSPEVLAQVEALCLDKRVLVIHDGDHSRDAVLRDLRLYAPLVSVGSYLIVEDGVMDLFRPGDGIGSFAPGPLAASEQFRREFPGFEVDQSRERYLMTYNPQGFLKRVR